MCGVGRSFSLDGESIHIANINVVHGTKLKFNCRLNLYPLKHLDGFITIELKEKDTFSDESTTYLICTTNLSDLKVGSGRSKAEIVAGKDASYATKKQFSNKEQRQKHSDLCPATLYCSFCCVKGKQ